MLSRLLARVVTGPLGFLAAGTLDVTAAWTRWGLHRVAVRRARRGGR